MSLVDRFIEFGNWPMSRKTALMSALSAAATFFGVLLGGYLVERVTALNLSLLIPYLAALVAAFVLLAVISFSADRAGRDARWTAYLFVLVVGTFNIAFMYLLGAMSTPAAAFLPCILFLWLLFFGISVGRAGMVWMFMLLIPVGYLEAQGILPYAPMLVNRSIDAQQSPYWFGTFLLMLLVLFAFCSVLGYLSLAAMRKQQARLQRTHDELAQSTAQQERSNKLMRRYVPAQLVAGIVSGEHREDTRPDRRKLTIFFSDIQGFTSASDAMDPEELAGLLNEYLAEMMAVADSYQATTNQIVGDGIMIFFGAPQATSDRDHALRAVRMALAMQARMRQLKEHWLERGLQHPFQVRIGINTGYASVGDFGSEGRRMYMAIGKQTHLTASIQSHCEPGGVLISHTTWALVQDEIPCVARGEIQVREIRHPVKVYQVATGVQPGPAQDPRA